MDEDSLPGMRCATVRVMTTCLFVEDIFMFSFSYSSVAIALSSYTVH